MGDLLVSVVHIGDGSKLRHGSGSTILVDGSKDVLVGDETGVVTLVLPPKDLANVANGDVLEIRSAYVSMTSFLERGLVSLCIDEESLIEHHKGLVLLEPLLQNNISRVKYMFEQTWRPCENW